MAQGRYAEGGRMGWLASCRPVLSWPTGLRHTRIAREPSDAPPGGTSMMRRALLPLTLALGLLVPTAATTVAFTGIDQRQEDTSIVVSSSGSGNQIAQSFTAGLDGTLVAIALHTDLSLDGTQLQIQEAWGSLPTDTVLSTTTIDSSAT